MPSRPADPTSAARALRRLARVQPPSGPEPRLRDWLQPHRDALFRWTMGMATSAEGRRAIAETAVAIQRLRGPDEFGLWLLAAALQAARLQDGAMPESAFAGLPPELRALLRLVCRHALQCDEALALLDQRMDAVRSRLVQMRLACRTAPAPLDVWTDLVGA